jgi:hypothetical protein
MTCDAAGRKAGLLMPHFPRDQEADGRWWCDVFAPGGAVVSGWCTFPDGAAAEETYAQVFGLFPESIDPVDLWFDAGMPGRTDPPGEVPDGLSMRVWAGNEGPLDPGTWQLQRDAPRGRLFTLNMHRPPSSEELTVELAWEQGPLFVQVRPSDHLYADIERSGSVPVPCWRVVPGLDLPAAYWSFYRHEHFTAASAVARELLQGIEEAEVSGSEKPSSADWAVVVGHAAIKLRTLGHGFRERASAAVERCDVGQLDRDAVRWMMRFDGAEPSETVFREELCVLSRRLVTERPFRTEILRLLFERLGTAARLHAETEDADPVVGEALDAVTQLARATMWECDTLTYRASRPSEFAPVTSWPGERARAAGQKKTFRTSFGSAW